MFHSCSQTSVGHGLLRILFVLTTLLLTTAAAQTQEAPTQSNTTPPRTDSRQIPTSPPPSGQTQPVPPQSGTSLPRTNTRQTPASQPSGNGHHTDTNPGQTPHGSSNGAAIAAGRLGGVAAGVVVGELIAHHNASPEHFGHDGPQVPKELDMSSFVIKGIVGPNWPVVLDFLLDSPGSVQIDIIAADKHQFRATMTNPPNRRAYGIFRLPPDFGSKLQTAVFQVRSISSGTTTTATSTAAPGLRTYGIGAGEKAVGSVAIDQLTFQPPTIHPKAKEVATYGFHAHSAFNGVRAEFISQRSITAMS